MHTYIYIYTQGGPKKWPHLTLKWCFISHKRANKMKFVTNNLYFNIFIVLAFCH